MSGWMGTVGGQRLSGLSGDYFWALVASLENIHRVVPKPHLHCLGCVLSLEVNLWTSLKSWGLCSFPSILTSFSVPAPEKHLHCFTVGMALHRWQEVPGFLHMWCSELRFIRPQNLVSQSDSHLAAVLCKFQACFHRSWTEERLPFRNYRGHCAFGDLQYNSYSQICASTQTCLWDLQAIHLTSWLGFTLIYIFIC